MQNPTDSFSPMTYNDWKKRAEKELSGQVTRLWENTEIPLYFTDKDHLTSLEPFDNRTGMADPNLPGPRSWHNITIIDDKNEKSANGHALNALMDGSDGILFRHSSHFVPDQLLVDLLPEYASLLFEDADEDFAMSFRTWLDQSDADYEAVSGYLWFPEETDGILPEMFRLFSEYKHLRFFHFHLNEASSMGYTEQLVDFMEDLTNQIDLFADKEIPLRSLWERLSLSVNCGPLFFEEIARLRALRLLVYKIFRAYGLEKIEPESTFIHGVSQAWSEESVQPHANMLKSCTTGLAMVLGGSSHISILPEDPASMLQQRIARNVSLILRDECYLDKVLDPAAGSYYIETLTKTLAKNAWESFTKSTAKK